MNYLEYYDLEAYLFEVVGQRFSTQGFLSTFDFFCIVIWKANRAKSRIARRLLLRTGSLDSSVEMLTRHLAILSPREEKMRYLIDDWGFHLPMASSILTVMHPEDFTVYDIRVCQMLGRHSKSVNLQKFQSIWTGYENYKRDVEQNAPADPSLRDKDRYLWGKSFCEDLNSDTGDNFGCQVGE
jgi:hypothetical protein